MITAFVKWAAFIMMHIKHTVSIWFMQVFICTGIYHAQSYIISGSYTSDLRIVKLKIERSFVYRPDNKWLYSHHASINYKS